MESTLWFKLFFRFLIVIIPIYVLSIYINDTSEDHVKDQLIHSMVLSNQFFIQSFEDEIAHTIRLQQELFSDTDLNKLSILSDTMNEYEKTSSILRVQEKIRVINNAGKFTQHVKVYITSLDRLITPYEISQPAPKDLNSLIVSRSKVGPILISWNNKLMLGNPYQTGRDANGQPIFLVGVELSISRIKDVLNQFSEVNKGGEIYFVNFDDNWMISNNVNDRDISEIIDYVKENVNLHKSNHNEIEINKDKYLIAYEYSDFLNFALIVNMPREHALGPFRTL